MPMDDPAMDDERPIEVFLDDFPPAIRDTGLRLRELILEARPDAVEGVRTGWRWIGYSLPERGPKRTFAWIGPEWKHIHLGFEHGTLMADPEHILQGAQERLRKFRYFTFAPEIDIDEAVILDYLRRSADVSTMPAAARRAMAELAAEPIEAD